MDTGWNIFIYSVLLGVVSYSVCLFITWRSNRIGLEEYLLGGNNALMSLLSITGSTFSTAIFFTAITALYFLFGVIVLPFIVISSFLGLCILKIKSKKIFDKSSQYKITSLSVSSVFRFKSITQEAGRPSLYYVFLFPYLALMTITEISAFNNVMETFMPHDAWASFIIYLVILSVGAYVFISGFRGVLVTDSLQTIVLIVALFVVLFSLDNAKIDNGFSKFFMLSRFGNTIAIIIGASLLCFAWFSSAPEILKRITTLRDYSDVAKAIGFSKMFVPIVLSFPIVIVVLAGIYPGFEGDTTVAYSVWLRILDSRDGLLPSAFLILITTAFFTTVDTYIITYLQMIFIVRNNTILEKIIPSIRNSSFIFILLCFAIAIQLSPIMNGIIGIYAAALTIPLFMIVYIYPLLMKKNLIRRISYASFVFQMIASVPLIQIVRNIVADKGGFHLGYPLIPICITGVEMVALIFNILYSRERRKDDKKRRF